MTEWSDVTLGDVCELKRGYDLPRGKRKVGNVPIVSSSGLTGFHSDAMVRAPGVVTGRYGTLGQVFYVTEDFWPLNTSLYVRDFKGNDPRFVAALLESMNLAQHDGAAAVPGLNRNQLHGLPVRVPDRATQEIISVILGALRDLIENCRRRGQVLEGMARAIYREWFVHFRYPGHENATLVESRLGPTPAAWAVRPLSDVAEARRGLSWDRSIEVESGGTPVVTIPNLKARLTFNGCTQLAGVSTSDKTRFSLATGDILLIGSNGNPDRVGHVVRVTESRDALFASFLMRVRADAVSTSDLLLYHQLHDPSGVIADIKATAVGATGLRNLRITTLREALVCVPDKATRDRFEAVCGPLHRAADLAESQTEGLARMRDLLLPKLVTGQVDVSALRLDELIEDSVA